MTCTSPDWVRMWIARTACAPTRSVRTLEVLRAYRVAMDAERVSRARLVATSAVRDAADGERFLGAAQDVVGVEAELLSGEEEGRLSYLGATAELAKGRARILVADVGGGSTEVVLGPQDSLASFSMDVGCVRLTERYLADDPPGAEAVSAAVAVIRAELDRAVGGVPELGTLGAGDRLVGLAGTVSTLAMMELGISRYRRDLIHHVVLSRAAVERWCDVLGSESMATRALPEESSRGPEGRDLRRGADPARDDAAAWPERVSGLRGGHLGRSGALVAPVSRQLTSIWFRSRVR